MLWNCLLCGALTVTLPVLACLVLAHLLLPLQAEDLIALLPARGNGAHLERSVRACLLLRRWGILRQDILIVDQGLTREGRSLALQLEKLDGAILFLPAPAARGDRPQSHSDEAGA